MASQVEGLVFHQTLGDAYMHDVQQPNGNESFNEIVCESL